jgi:hypothetical protein
MAKKLVRQKTSDLFAEIEKTCSADETRGIRVGSDETNCTITNDLISLTVGMNVVNGELSVSKWSHRAVLPGEPISGFQFPPKALAKTRFVPDWPTGRTFGWRENGRAALPVLSVAELAQKCVSQFIALEQRDENGLIKRGWRGAGGQAGHP